ncbi:hypothetical protein WEU32_06855 [Brevundimonas sp. BH3]|uniref:hypothetical protein n=1 Tax=Brevundimonas sp. BH3 TaxID=3133089 RepID=UPI0032500267
MDDNNNIFLKLGEIIGRLDSLVALTTAKHSEYDKKHDEADQRLKKLEHGKAWLLGAAAAVGAGASFIVGLFK